MNVQVPNSIKKVSNEIASVVRANYPNVFDLSDCSIELQDKWETRCNHELFYQDANRFIGDIYQQKSLETPAW